MDAIRMIIQNILLSAHTLHVTHKHGGGHDCKKELCGIANWLHTSRFSPYPDTCALCGKVWYPNFYQLGYQWTCDKCRHPSKDCECGSDDIALEWHIVEYPNGGFCPDPVWIVECNMCERMTAYFEIAKEANEAWMNGYAEKVMPLPFASPSQAVELK